MTVQTLIDLLKECDPESQVVSDKDYRPITRASKTPMGIPGDMMDCCGGDTGTRIVVVIGTDP